MANELMDALEICEQEKGIDREVLFNAIEKALTSAYSNHFSKNAPARSDGQTFEYTNVRVDMNRETGEYHIFSVKEIVEQVTDKVLEISLDDARLIDDTCSLGDYVEIEVGSRDFSRIATMTAKNSILQAIREAERDALLEEFQSKEGQVVTGIVQRQIKNGLSINLGKAEAKLMENDMVPGENLRINDRVKVYVRSVQKNNKGLLINVSRSDPMLVKKLFEAEVAEIQNGTVEIRGISREKGVRSKIVVWSNDPDVDPVGACVGVNGMRVSMVVDELRGEKVDIVKWDDNPANLIENALAPAHALYTIANPADNTAKVVVPDNQLSLAIGKSGLNAKLAAKLTGFKIDIKSESQADNYKGFRSEDYHIDENGNLVLNEDEDEPTDSPVSED